MHLVAFRFLPILAATPENGEMAELNGEAMLLEDGFLHPKKQVLFKFQGSPALATDEVMVVAVFAQMILRPSLTEVGLHKRPQSLEELQVTVNGGEVDVAIAGLDPPMDLLSDGVALTLCKRSQRHEPLTGKAVTELLQGLRGMVHLPPQRVLRVLYHMAAVNASSCNSKGWRLPRVKQSRYATETMAHEKTIDQTTQTVPESDATGAEAPNQTGGDFVID